MRIGEPVYKKSFTKPLPSGAKVFSRKHIGYARYTDPQGNVQDEKLTKDGKKILCETQHYYIRFDDNNGIRRTVKAYTDKGSSDYLYSRIQELVNAKRKNQSPAEDLQEYLGQDEQVRQQLAGFGLLKIEDKPDAEMLDELIDGFKEHLTKKERSQRHIKAVTGTLKRIFRNCYFTTWEDISAEVLKNYLDDQRDGGQGLSKGRYNNVLKMIKQFSRWYVKTQRQDGNFDIKDPVEYLDCLDNVQTDSRHPRRALDIDDFRRFLFAALTGAENHRLTGRERNFMYRFAAETAMRKIDFMRLRVRDCNFKESKIFIQAGRTKNKSDAYVSLRQNTALELKQYCANKLPDAKVFHMPVHPEHMVQFDLANTEIKDANGKVLIPAIPYRDNFGKYFDFHSLRHQSASLFAMNPETSEAVRQKLTRHKTPEMVRHYSHTFENQQRQAVESLPDLMQIPQEQMQIKTGTDNLFNACFMDDSIRPNMTQNENTKKEETANTAINRIISAECKSESSLACFCETPLSE